LKEVVGRYDIDDAPRQAFFEAVSTISSDGEHRQVLSALLKKAKLSKETISQALESGATISADGEKAEILIQIARVTSRDNTMTATLLQAVETISSDGEYRRVMSALIKNEAFGKELATQK
jgi:predicted regulator of amino acid metabolism with ACT domain